MIESQINREGKNIPELPFSNPSRRNRPQNNVSCYAGNGDRSKMRFLTGQLPRDPTDTRLPAMHCSLNGGGGGGAQCIKQRSNFRSRRSPFQL